MKKLSIPAIILACVLAALSAAAQPRGNGRIEGKVEDDKGQPAADVVIRATLTGQPNVVSGKTNNKGEWRLNNLAAGDWVVEFQKEGFEPNRINVTLGPNERKPPITVALARPVDPSVDIQEQAKKAIEFAQAGKFADARKVYEDLLAKYPTIQIHPFIARTYAAEKNFDKAIEHAKLGLTSEPDSVDTQLLLADVYMEKGDKDEALKVLGTVDMTKAPDPVSFINASITLINDQKPDEAIAMLSKVIAQWPQQAEPYYYRGRGYIAAKKMPEAKADLEKYVSVARPDAPQLADAKKLLEQLKDVK
jgi:thioredoxin-like negative regulator of GroEL